ICGFHIGIAVLMGLPWFSLAMIAVDAVFVRDSTWRGLGERLVRAWREGRARATGAPAVADADADPPSERDERARRDADELETDELAGDRRPAREVLGDDDVVVDDDLEEDDLEGDDLEDDDLEEDDLE